MSLLSISQILLVDNQQSQSMSMCKTSNLVKNTNYENVQEEQSISHTDKPIIIRSTREVKTPSYQQDFHCALTCKDIGLKQYPWIKAEIEIKLTEVDYETSTVTNWYNIT